jgi:SPP1 gp7 family putative phage head morphogenesis protein
MTPQPTILSTVADFRSRLTAKEDTAKRSMRVAYKDALDNHVEPAIEKLLENVSSEDSPSKRMSTLYQAMSLQRTKDLLTEQMDQFGATALQQVSLLQMFGIRLGVDFALKILGLLLPVSVLGSFGVPSTNALEELVGVTQAGSPLASLFRSFGRDAAKRVVSVLVGGVSMGRNPRQIASQVRDALSITKSKALTIARQEMIRCYRNSTLKTYQKNEDVLDRWRWNCKKSTRTCVVCLAMDGKTFPLNTPFESHVVCRCAPVPVTKPYSEILRARGIEPKGVTDTSPYEGMQTGKTWFEAQTPDVQRRIIGNNAGYELYAKGDVRIEDFVKYSFDEHWGGSRTQRPARELTVL